MEASSIGKVALSKRERLQPCKVELRHTTYHEVTLLPTTRTTTVRTLVRAWDADPHARETGWSTVAPIPLTVEQARTLLPSPSESQAGGQSGEKSPSLIAFVGDGVLTYRFDARGRTARVGWGPTADSSDYEYHYRYDCPQPGGPAPAFEDDAR
jgi:hypothetical protein